MDLAALPGRRKALFYFGVGVRMPDPRPPRNETMEFAHLTQVFRDAQRANVNIYPVDPRGLAVSTSSGAKPWANEVASADRLSQF